MNESRLTDYLDHIKQAAIEACGFIEDLINLALPKLLEDLQ